MEANTPTRGPQRVSAALAAAQAQSALAAPVRFPGEDRGRSLAEMAQRDLDAALQLLADRAQYITGASGAAIALRRAGRNDMLCRATTGSNAPELGALLSTEFGLSGESVRTRQLLRCDDAERDTRVNREACRQLGIASVLVMPVVNDDQVLGVFELFSGKANAFGERDLSAVQRLSEMVETAVRLAHATETLPEQLKTTESAADAEAQKGPFVNDLVVKDPAKAAAVEAVPEDDEVLESVVDASPADSLKTEVAAWPVVGGASVVVPETAPPQAVALPVVSEQSPTAPGAPSSADDSPKKTLFWSAALDSDAEAGHAEADQSHVPPVLRGLRKCEACGFPVSAGRVLCVECEEKKWRGQLRSSQAGRSTAAKPTTPAPPASVASKSAAPAFAAAVSMGKTSSVLDATASSPALSLKMTYPAAVPATQSAKEISQPVRLNAGVSSVHPQAPSELATQREGRSPDLVLSSGLEPSQSWLSRNKYVVGVLVVSGAAIAAVFLLR